MTQFLTPASLNWPQRLQHLHRPPDRLWFRGHLEERVAVAVVGSRQATLAGLAIAEEIGGRLAEAGIAVLSGLARGIDAAAHRGALAAGGVTWAVLGCGVDIYYPPQNRRLQDQIAEKGCLISEFPPGTTPRREYFPQRNRLIAALCCAVIVVEATPRSGALSTASQAATLGRDVFAVPGSIKEGRSRGTNLLIRDGAHPYLEFEDLLGLVPELGTTTAAGAGTAPAAAPLPPPLQAVYQLLGSEAVHPDALALELGLEMATLAPRLAELEIRGHITTLMGGLVAKRV